MNTMRKPLRSLVNMAVVSMMASGMAHATGFALYTEGNGYSTGNYGAGVAAEAYDASTGWYNPAGLALIRNEQLVLGGVGVFPTSSVSGRSTYTMDMPGLTPYVQTFNNIDGAENAVVPSMHYARPIGENATFALSLVSPFGLSTNWDEFSPVRYQATFTQLLTMNLSPEVGAKLSDNFSIGAGIDLQHAQVKFNRMIGAPNIGPALDLSPMFADTMTYNKGDSNGVGFHAGVMAVFNENHTRLGLNFQSQMRHVFKGYSRLSGRLANDGAQIVADPTIAPAVAWSNTLNSSPIVFPSVLTLSGYHDLSSKLAVLASAVYTGWDSFKTIQLNNIMAPDVAEDGFATISLVNLSVASPQNFKNVWRLALGANYKLNDTMMLRVGGGYDETPTNDIDRDMRLPDASRWALAIGGHYQARPNLGLDLGYTHLFAVKNPTINRTDVLNATNSYNVNAVAKANADLIGVQLTWLMDKEKHQA